MNIERPYRPVLIVDSRKAAPESHIGRDEIPVALEIHSDEPVVHKNILKALIEGNTPFLLLVNQANGTGEGGIASEISELIRLCLFSRNYIRQGNSPVIAFIGDEDHRGAAAGEDPEAFNAWLRLQGWPFITRWTLPTLLSFREQVVGKMETPLLVEQIDFDEAFLLNGFFHEPDNIGKYIFFKSTAAHSAAILEQAFFRLCGSAIDAHPFFRTYLTHYLSARKAVDRLQNENDVLRERLDNAETTIEVIRTKYKGDYDILFEWYKKEYEVLPLWYKRFGHIIKAVMGKRTFRSLLSDDEKKINSK